MSTVPYHAPQIPELLSLSSFICLINVAENALQRLVHAGLLGPLVMGILWGPEVANLIPDHTQSTFIALGYIGLLLIVFEAATIGVGMPIALSLLLLHFGYGYSLMQAFAAGSALCSTSLGTTLALLSPSLRQTRVGAVLTSAALLDDVVGLVIAAIIAQLAANTGLSAGGIGWRTIVRPIGVSLAFGVGTPVIAFVVGKAVRWKLPQKARLAEVQLLLIVATLMGFVAASKYAGTSELFGAYLAGTFLTHVFAVETGERHDEKNLQFATPHSAFERYIAPLLLIFLSPIFFASIGTALPIRSLGSVNGSQGVVWRGIVYALLMFIAKFVVGISIWVWPNPGQHGWLGGTTTKNTLSPIQEAVEEEENAETSFSRNQGALLLGFAMVARGEIALIVAQIARPLLVEGEDGLEAFAVVTWAILLTTISGAAAVGTLLRMRDSRIARAKETRARQQAIPNTIEG